jgi:hypothetical protein
MSKEKYIKPEVTKQTLEAEVLTSNHGSPNGGNTLGGGGGVLAGWQWKKNWH